MFECLIEYWDSVLPLYLFRSIEDIRYVVHTFVDVSNNTNRVLETEGTTTCQVSSLEIEDLLSNLRQTYNL